MKEILFPNDKLFKSLLKAVMAISLVFVILYRLNNLVFTSNLVFVTFLSFITCFVLNNKGLHTISKHLFFLVTNATVLINSLTISNSISYFYFTLVIAPVLIFGDEVDKKHLHQILWIVTSFALLIICTIPGINFQIYETIPTNITTVMPYLIKAVTASTLIYSTLKFMDLNKLGNEQVLLAKNKQAKVQQHAEIGRMLAGVAHEIRNPLNFIINFSQTLLKDIKELKLQPGQEESLEDIYKSLEIIETSGNKTNDIIQSMLYFSKKPITEVEIINVADILKESISLYRKGLTPVKNLSDDSIRLQLDKTELYVYTNPQNLARAILNLTDNAIFALRHKTSENDLSYTPTLDIKLYQQSESVCIEFLDNGDGIPQDIMKKIFTPFYTTKPGRQGTGLGLSMVNEFATIENDGAITVDSEEKKWTKFKLCLPMVK
jgi:two-component system NtrC family sensor kinase